MTPPTQSAKSRILRIYVPPALVCYLGVFAIAYLAAYRELGGFLGNRPRQFDTATTLAFLQERISEYRDETGMLPSDIRDLELKRFTDIPVDEDGRPLDGWGRPFRAELGEDEYEIVSLGRDGEPGGRGLDADWKVTPEVHPGRGTPRHTPTFLQFVQARDDEEIVGNSVLMWAAASGLLALVTFIGSVIPFERRVVRRQARDEDEFYHVTISHRDMIGQIFVTVTGTSIVSVLLVFLHIQNGH